MDVEFLLMKAVGGRTMFGNAGFKHFENKKKYEERKKENPNSDEMRANRYWLRKSIV